MSRAPADPRPPARRAPAGPLSFRAEAAVIAACTTVVALAPRAGHAYLDPGVASFAIQAIVGGIAAVAAAIGGYWRRILALLRRRPAADRASGADRGREA
jgi:hypothetical protein